MRETFNVLREGDAQDFDDTSLNSLNDHINKHNGHPRNAGQLMRPPHKILTSVMCGNYTEVNLPTEDVDTFDEILSKSSLMKQLLENQKEIFNKLNLVATQNKNLSEYSSDKYITLAELTVEQKSKLSQFMRCKFGKIKFLCEDEWTQLGKNLLPPIYDMLGIDTESDRKYYLSVVKSYANGCINQKRAEVMRHVKQVVKGKTSFVCPLMLMSNLIYDQL